MAYSVLAIQASLNAYVLLIVLPLRISAPPAVLSTASVAFAILLVSAV